MTDAGVLKPERGRREGLVLTAVGLACALVSSAAFWLHMLGLVPMPFFVNVVGGPSIILMLILGLFSWQRDVSFWSRLRAGLAGGVVALAAYDLIRLTIFTLWLHDYFPYQTHRIFGYLITGQPPESQAALIWGWAYHFWNGMSFAVIYALIAGSARWYWGWAWAMILEIAMLFTYPTMLQIKFTSGFLGVSLIGHTAFGIALGLMVSRLARDET
jgi:hypothetical protein